MHLVAFDAAIIHDALVWPKAVRFCQDAWMHVACIVLYVEVIVSRVEKLAK